MSKPLPSRLKPLKHQEKITAFGIRLQALREKRGMSRQNLADDCDVSKTTIIRIERGQFNFKIDLLLSIAGAFEMSLSELLGDTNNENHHCQ